MMKILISVVPALFGLKRHARLEPTPQVRDGQGVQEPRSVPADRIARVSSTVAAITMSMTPRGAHNGSSIQGGTMLRLRP